MNETTPLEFPVEKIHAAHRRVMTIIGGIASSLIIYVIVVEVLLRSQPDTEPVLASIGFRMGIYAVAISAVFLATVMRYIMLRQPPATPEARLQRMQSTSMLGAALSELPAVLGLMQFFITRNRGDFYVMVVLSAYMLIRHLPLRGTWENYVRRGTDHR